MSDASLRIGVTMRRSNAVGYDEERDSLARDWPPFLRWALPEARWMPLPNAGAEIVQVARAWDLQALILTGGEDLGRDTLRDTTELALLHHACAASWPVLGICRGLQLMCHEFGGILAEIDRARHVASTHEIRFPDDVFGLRLRDSRARVNSFHGIGIPADAVPKNFTIVAQSEDGYAEALADPAMRLLGLMWHPERERPFTELDRRLIRAHLLGTS